MGIVQPYVALDVLVAIDHTETSVAFRDVSANK